MLQQIGLDQHPLLITIRYDFLAGFHACFKWQESHPLIIGKSRLLKSGKSDAIRCCIFSLLAILLLVVCNVALLHTRFFLSDLEIAVHGIRHSHFSLPMPLKRNISDSTSSFYHSCTSHATAPSFSLPFSFTPDGTGHPVRDNHIGDGAWGVSTRKDENAHKRWYLEKVTDDHHFWNITLYPESRVAQAFNPDGGLLDFFEQTIREPRARDVFGIRDNQADIPGQLILSQNYPNPFNPLTTISFFLPEDSGNTKVRLDVFDMYGQRVKNLVNSPLRAGAHTVTFDSREAPISSGTYVYRLQYHSQTRSRKMQLVK